MHSQEAVLSLQRKGFFPYRAEPLSQQWEEFSEVEEFNFLIFNLHC